MKKNHLVITGASQGLGLVIAQRLLGESWKVSLLSRKKVSGIEPSLKKSSLWIKTDARLPHSLRRSAKEAATFGGPFNLWINNVGISAWRPLKKIDEKFWNEMVETNLKSTLFGCQAALSYMQKGGVIINISSLAGKRGSANNSVYCATKFGVNGITQSLAKELGPRGIRVNAVCPVYLQTPGLKTALRDKYSPSKGKAIGSYLKKFADENAALHRLPEAEEVANLCLFLASASASAITGQCINVDCGVFPL